MHSPILNDLTERQAAVLAFILDFTRRNGFNPSCGEIADNFDISPNGASAHLTALRTEGYLELASGPAPATTPTLPARRRRGDAGFTVLVAMARLCLTRGEMPTYGELAAALAVDERTVIQHLRRLKDLGYIDWAPPQPRSVRFLNAAWPVLATLAS